MADCEILPISIAALQRAVTVLHEGGVVAFPTDTVYGLCCDLYNEAAVAKIYHLKGRPARMPLIAMFAEMEDWSLVAESVSPAALQYMKKWWPGPLTIIVPARPDIPELVLGGGTTIGMRIPDNNAALQLLRLFQRPLATTSANLSGQPVASSADEIRAQLDGQVDMILDAGPSAGGVASTVVNCAVDPPIILREGPVDFVMLGLEQK